MSNISIVLEFGDLTHGDLRKFVEETAASDPDHPVGFEIDASGDISGFREWL